MDLHSQQRDGSSASEPYDRDDIIIAVMGVTGVGKSSVINLALGADRAEVGTSLRSCTTTVNSFSCRHPHHPNRNVIFVDTPGFDDTNFKETDILQNIAEWLEKTYRKGFILAGILYLHRITDNRMAHTPLSNLELFGRLCGPNAYKNVILVTTMWDLGHDVSDEVRKRDMESNLAREEELKSHYWQPMIRLGSKVKRLLPRQHEMIWSIVDSFTAASQPLQVQIEMVDEGKPLAFTTAGSFLYQILDAFRRRFAALLGKVRARSRARWRSVDDPDDHDQTWAQDEATAKAEQERLMQAARTPPSYPESPSSYSSTQSSGTTPLRDDENEILYAAIKKLKSARSSIAVKDFRQLNDVIQLALDIAESLQKTKENRQAYVVLTSTFARFISSMAEQLGQGAVLSFDPVRSRTRIEDLTRELELIRRAVKRKKRRQGDLRRTSMGLDGDQVVFLMARFANLNSAYHDFQVEVLLNVSRQVQGSSEIPNPHNTGAFTTRPATI